MTKSKKVIGALIFAMIFVLAASIAFGIFTSGEAFAYNADPSASVGELWQGGSKPFNASNLKTLYGKLSDGASDLAAVANSTSYAGKAISDKGIIVEFGGLKWLAVYLSKADDAHKNAIDAAPFGESVGYATKDDVVLTLWLSYVPNDDAHKGKWSTFGSGEHDGTIDKIPTNMYGTSYMRSQVLNNGGAYLKSQDVLETENCGKSADNIYAKFTMGTDGATDIADYLVAPRYIDWQYSQSSQTSAGYELELNNDAWGTDNKANFFSEKYHYRDTTDLNYYTAWKDDLLWLPSSAEIGGWSDSSQYGLWNTTAEQRQSSNDYAWLRSAFKSNPDNSCYIEPAGTVYGNQVLYSYLVRPALHLNLTRAAAVATVTVDDNTTGYATFDKALEAAENAVSPSDGTAKEYVTLKMFADATYNGTIITPNEVDFTLDLNNNTLTFTTDLGWSIMHCENGAWFTLTDTSSESKGVYKGNITVNDGNFTINKSCDMIGNVTQKSASDFTMCDSCTLTGNVTVTRSFTLQDKATINGGVFVDGGAFTMTGGTITNPNGSGVDIISGGTFTMSGGTITGCRAEQGAGVSCMSGDRLIISGSAKITNNTATGQGGGLYIVDPSICNIEGGTVSGNQAESDGGGIYLAEGTIDFKDCTISGNNATNGGGIYMEGGTLNLNGGSITNNKATGNGNGVYVTDYAKLSMKNGEVTGTVADGEEDVYVMAKSRWGGDFTWGGGDVGVAYLENGAYVEVQSSFTAPSEAIKIDLDYASIGEEAVRVLTWSGTSPFEHFKSVDDKACYYESDNTAYIGKHKLSCSPANEWSGHESVTFSDIVCSNCVKHSSATTDNVSSGARVDETCMKDGSQQYTATLTLESMKSDVFDKDHSYFASDSNLTSTTTETIPHKGHAWEYSVKNGALTAECTNPKHNSGVSEDGAQSFAVKFQDPKTEYAYNGSEMTLQVGGDSSFPGGWDVTYKYKKEKSAAEYGANEGNPKNAGFWQAVLSAKEDKNAPKAELTFEFEIKKAMLTVTAKPHTLTYGDENFCNSGVEYSGFLGGTDDVSVVKGAPDFEYSYKRFDDVNGDYTITPTLGTLSADNYDFTFVAAKLTVDQKKITVEIQLPKDLTYGYGEDFTAVFAAVETVDKSFVSAILQFNGTPNDKSTFANSATKPTLAGTYTVKVTGIEGPKALNYDLQNDGQQTFTVDPKALNVVVKEPSSLVYGNIIGVFSAEFGNVESPKGERDQVYAVLTYSGSANDGTPASADVMPDKAGNYQVTVTIDGAKKDNYTLAETIRPFEIKRAEISVSGKFVASEPYSATGFTQTISTAGNFNGLTVSMSPADPNFKIYITTEANAKTYEGRIEVAEYDEHNFSVSLDAPTYEVTILPKTVSTIWSDLKLEYSGKAQAPKASANTDIGVEKIFLSVRLENGDTGVLGGARGTDAINVGDYKATATITSAEGTETGNYVLSGDTTTFNITQAALTVTWDGPYSYEYGSSPATPTASANFKEDDLGRMSVQARETKDAAFKNVGDYNFEAVLVGDAKDNYDITLGKEQKYSITRASLTAELHANVVYGDEFTNANVTVTISSGIKYEESGETLAAAAKAMIAQFATDYDRSATHVGDSVHVWHDGTVDLVNYTASFERGDVVVEQRAISLALDGELFNTYGEECGIFSATASRADMPEDNWFGHEEDMDKLSASLLFKFAKDGAGEAKEYDKTMGAGNYTISAAWREGCDLARDYRIVGDPDNNAYKVNRRALTISMTACAEYGEAAPAITFTKGEGITAWDVAEDILAAAKSVAAFDYGGYGADTPYAQSNAFYASSEPKELDNYDVSYTSCPIEITRREIKVKLTFSATTYGEDPNEKNWVVAEAFRTGAGEWYAACDGNDIGVLKLSYTLTGTGSAPTNRTAADTYEVVPAWDNDNYSVTFEDSQGGNKFEYKINQKKITVEIGLPADLTYGYDGDFTATFAGVEDDDKAFVSAIWQFYGAPNDASTFEDSKTKPTLAGAYFVKVVGIEGAKALNYDLQNDGQKEFTVRRATVKKPTADTETVFTYTGDMQTYNVKGGDSEHFAVKDNEQKDANETGYTVTVYLRDKYNRMWESDGDAEDDADLKFVFVIHKAEIAVEWGDETYVYTGSPFETLPTAKANGIKDDGVFELKVLRKFEGDFMNAGSYPFEAELDGEDARTNNYTLEETSKKATYVVEKQALNAPHIEPKVYNGEPQTADVPYSELYTVSENVGGTDAAVYSVKITLTEAASKNFKWKDSEIVDLTVEFAILKADYDMSGVTFDDLTLIYDAEEHSLYIEGDLPYGVTVTYDGNGKKTPGRYTVTANFKGDELNHNLIPSKEATLEILEVSHDLSGIVFEDMTVKYDGEAHDVLINGELPTNVTVTYEGNGQTDPAIYTVTAVFRDPDGVFAQMTATLTILRTQTQVEPSAEEKESDVFIESEEGFDPTLELVVEKIEGVERTYLAWGKDQVSEKFVVKMCKDGVEVQIDGKVTVRLLIPEEFRSKDFELMTVARSASVEYTRDGDYVIFVADGLSAYVFTSTYTSYFSVIIIATGVLFADVLILIALAVVLKKKRNSKMR